mgnify:CR=1 FL=1
MTEKGKLVYIPSSVTLYQFHDPPLPPKIAGEWLAELGESVKRFRKTEEPKNVLVLNGDVGGRGKYSEVLYDSERWFVKSLDIYRIGE